jgi:hypothetical protein
MGKPDKNEPLEKKSFKKEDSFAKKEEEPKPVVQSSGNKLTSDFKNPTRLIQHIDKLDSSAKEAFAKKYNITYQNVSEIRNNARAEFWKGN